MLMLSPEEIKTRIHDQSIRNVRREIPANRRFISEAGRELYHWSVRGSSMERAAKLPFAVIGFGALSLLSGSMVVSEGLHRTISKVTS